MELRRATTVSRRRHPRSGRRLLVPGPRHQLRWCGVFRLGRALAGRIARRGDRSVTIRLPMTKPDETLSRIGVLRRFSRGIPPWWGSRPPRTHTARTFKNAFCEGEVRMAKGLKFGFGAGLVLGLLTAAHATDPLSLVTNHATVLACTDCQVPGMPLFTTFGSSMGFPSTVIRMTFRS